MNERKWYEPEQVFEEYQRGIEFKNGLSERGLYAQNRMNERFFTGDQWYGAQCGNDRPLVRHNVIKRIGDYKLAMIGSSSIAVNYTAEGVPNTKDIQERVRSQREEIRKESGGSPITDAPQTTLTADEKISLAMSAMSDYYKVTAERVKLDVLKTTVLRNAYIGGTGILYTYWDSKLNTGLYADEARQEPILGDIRCEALDIENVYFGDPNKDSVQEQPFILIQQRKSVEDLKREARRNKISRFEIDKIVPDSDTGNEAGDRSQKEPADAGKATVITKLFKEWNKEGTDYTIKAVMVTKHATIRKEWDIGVQLYPIAKLNWETRRNCVYGDSEITHLIPNQIAINRALTSEIWSVMMYGMPTLLVSEYLYERGFSNNPGEIVPVPDGDFANAVQYVQAGSFQPGFDKMVNNLIGNTMTQSGANDAALGDMKPDNTSAIIAVREAATMPMQLLQNRFYAFMEDVARIWAEFWVKLYGKRSLKVEDDSGEWYMPFDGEEYRNVMITARVDVGAGSMWSEVQSVKTLDNLYERDVIDVEQYLERLPRGIVPKLGQLLREIQEKKQAMLAAETQKQAAPTAAAPAVGMDPATAAQMMPENYKRAYQQMPPEVKQQVAMKMLGAQTPSFDGTGI